MFRSSHQKCFIKKASLKVIAIFTWIHLRWSLNGRLNDELQAPWLSCVSNTALFNLKLLLSVSWNICSKKWLHDLFFYEYSNISPIIFHWQPWVKNTFGEKELLCKIISLSTRETFFFKCQTLHISEINSFLDLKWSKRLLDNRLRTTSCNGMWHGSMTLRICMFIKLWNSFPEELKTKQDYSHKSNWKPF